MFSGKNKTMAYDAENRLISVNESGTVTNFVYDGDGGRVRKMADAGGGTISSTTYIGSLYEVDSTGKTTKHIFAGSQRICSVTTDYGLSTTNSYYYHPDHLGSSNVITGSTGAQAQYCEYTPYGRLARNEGSDITAYKFTGKELDQTGLYFYGARYYDPEIGRFITADTIVGEPYNPQSFNRYAYCYNNPVNYIDPSGHLGFLATLIWVAVIIAIGWALDEYAGAEVNVGGGATVRYDTGPSSTHYSSSNPYPSAPQTNNPSTNSSSSSGGAAMGNQNAAYDSQYTSKHLLIAVEKAIEGHTLRPF